MTFFSLWFWLLIDETDVKCFRNSYPEVLYKKGVIKNLQNSQENFSARVSFSESLACNFVKKDSGTGVFLRILQKF